jgi:hypothetical protein
LDFVFLFQQLKACAGSKLIKNKRTEKAGKIFASINAAARHKPPCNGDCGNIAVFTRCNDKNPYERLQA